MNEQNRKKNVQGNDFEEEIDLRSIIIFLWRKKFTIVLAMILFGVIGLIIAGKLYPKKYITNCEVALKFQGIEMHHNPDGSVFSPQQIIAPNIITNAILKYNLDQKKYQGVEKYLSIRPVIPDEVKKNKKTDKPFFPNQYVIKFNAGQNEKFTSNEREKFLVYVVDSFRQEYTKRYGGQIISQLNINQNIIEEGDYVDIITTYEAIVDNLILLIDGKVKESNNYTSSRSGLSFDQVKRNLELLKTININKPKSLVQNLKLTKDQDSLENVYRFKIVELEAERAKKISEAKVANNLIQSVMQPSISEIPKNEQANSDNKEKISISLDKSLLDEIRKNDYYQMLIKTALEAEIQAGNLEVEIAEIQRNLSDLQKIKAKDSSTDYATKKVKSSLDTLNATLKEWIEKSSILNQDYMQTQLGSIIQIVRGPSSSSSYSKLFFIFILLGFVFPLGCFFVWAITDQLFNTNPKK